MHREESPSGQVSLLKIGVEAMKIYGENRFSPGKSDLKKMENPSKKRISDIAGIDPTLFDTRKFQNSLGFSCFLGPIFLAKTVFSLGFSWFQLRV